MKTRILVIDDEPDFTMLVRAHLESLGHFNVQEENDSTNAVRAAREFDPDLILLDIMMPEMDGSEVAAHLCADARLSDVPVIFLTALVQKVEVVKGSFISGGRTYLPKPVDFETLVECIQEKVRARRPATAAAPTIEVTVNVPTTPTLAADVT